MGGKGSGKGPRPVKPELRGVLEHCEEILRTQPMPDWGLALLLRDLAFYGGARGRFCLWCNDHFRAKRIDQQYCSLLCNKRHEGARRREAAGSKPNPWHGRRRGVAAEWDHARYHS